METLSSSLTLCAGKSPVNSPHKGQWRGAWMFSLICAWINGWVNNGETRNLRDRHAHYNVNVIDRQLLRFTNAYRNGFPHLYNEVYLAW